MFPDALCTLVQHNCNIADARHAGHFTLCTYLMKMREYCRWDKGYAYTDVLPKEEVGRWVSQRELLWHELEQQSFTPVEIDSQVHDPFDIDKINQALLPKGLVYSAGVGVRSAPHFFLARLAETQTYGACQVYIVGQECARDLSAPPAMTLGDRIFIRTESIQRMLWEKVQEWQWHKIDNAMSRALAFYNFKEDAAGALQRMAENELQAIILHEQGEIDACKILGEEWRTFLAAVSSARLELMLRALKDFYADTLRTLPALIAQGNHASIYFYAANMSALRKQLSPSFTQAYKQWDTSRDTSLLHDWLERGARHWHQLIDQVLRLHRRGCSESVIERYIERHLL